jgi:hypothetical protein
MWVKRGSASSLISSLNYLDDENEDDDEDDLIFPRDALLPFLLQSTGEDYH